LDYLLTGDHRALSLLTQLNTWIKFKTNGDPSKIRSGYDLDGSDIPDESANHMSFIVPFAVSAMIDASNQEWLNKLWTHMNSSDDRDFYGKTLKLLCMVVISHNWWFPES
jgi:endoglucanase